MLSQVQYQGAGLNMEQPRFESRAQTSGTGVKGGGPKCCTKVLILRLDSLMSGEEQLPCQNQNFQKSILTLDTKSWRNNKKTRFLPVHPIIYSPAIYPKKVIKDLCARDVYGCIIYGCEKPENNLNCPIIGMAQNYIAE